MDLYLNDWSCNGSAHISQYRAEVLQFRDLVKTIHRISGCKIVIDRSFNRYIICEYPISGCYKPYDESIPDDFRGLLLQLTNYIDECVLDANIALHHPTTHTPSVLVGHAHSNESATVSFVFDRTYAAPNINALDGRRTVQVANLHEPADVDALYPQLCPRQECRKYNPTVNPLWNQDVTKNYRNAVIDSIRALNGSPGEKIKVLIQHGTAVANLNGWVYDEALSKKNSNAGQIRHIFRSEHFSKGRGYLSIDFEKNDICFELHDKRGNHLGELRWDGDLGEPEQGHSIKV